MLLFALLLAFRLLLFLLKAFLLLFGLCKLVCFVVKTKPIASNLEYVKRRILNT